MIMDILIGEAELKAIIRTTISEMIDECKLNKQKVLLNNYEKHQVEQCTNNRQGGNRSNNVISNEII